MSSTTAAAVLGAFGIHDAVVTPWHRHGSTSASLVTRPGFPDLVLTAGHLAASPAQLRLRAAIIDHLAAEGVPVAVPVRTADGDPFVVADDVLHLLAQRLFPPLGAEDVPRLSGWRHVGEQLAGLHRALATAPSGLESWRVDLPTQTRDTDVPAVQAAREDGRLPADVGARIDVPALLDRLPGLPEQRLHGDCHGGNLLVCERGLYGIVDLDHLPVGPRIYDLGYYCADLVKNRRYFPDDVVQVVGAVVNGYHGANLLSAAEADAVVAFMLATEFQFLRLFAADHPPGNQDKRPDGWHDENLAAHINTMRVLESRLEQFERAVAAAAT